jgi:uncharacterized delta-60 repeat protein
MSYGLTRLLANVTLPLLLFGCSPPDQPPVVDPYANGQSHPWEQTGRVSPQSLTPGVNTLQYETATLARNSWGPVERNRSNGEQQAGDGKPLTLNGQVYAQGYGVHAGSEVRFSLKGTGGAQCNTFTADVGVDDEVGSRGSVVFQVFADGLKLYDSGLMTGNSLTKRVNVGVVGRQELRLVVTDAGNGISYDHADWADPRLDCATTLPRAGSLDTSWKPQSVSMNPGGGFMPGHAVLEPDLNVLFGALFVRQADGKRLVITNTQTGQFEVARRFPDGTLDPSYGQGGRVVTDFAPGRPDPSSDGPQAYGAQDAVLQPDGKLVVAGTGERNLSSDFAVARYTTDGRLDPTFGHNGVVFTSLEPLKSPELNDPPVFSADASQSVALGPNGTLVVMGEYRQPPAFTLNRAVVRYNANGSLDTTLRDQTRPLGMTGITTNVSGSAILRVESNGDMVVGSNSNGNYYVGVLVKRLHRDGSRGGDTGSFFLGPQSWHSNALHDVALQADGKILVGGDAGLGEGFSSGVLVRLNADLSFDSTFGSDGTGQVVTTPQSGGISKLLVQPDGKIVVVEDAIRRFWP